MNFKEGIIDEANKNKEPKDTGSLSLYFSDDNKNPLTIYWTSENGEFEYVYCGSKTMCRSLKFKGITCDVTTPKIVVDEYKRIVRS